MFRRTKPLLGIIMLSLFFSSAAVFLTAGPVNSNGDLLPLQKAVVICSTDYTTYAHSLIPIDRPRTARNNLVPTDAETTVAAYGRYFYRIEKFRSDNVIKFDMDAPTTPVWQFSTNDAGSDVSSNPYDLIFVSSVKAYLLRYGTTKAWIVNPSATTAAEFKIGEIDLSDYADADGIPEMAGAVIADGKLFIICQRLDRDNWWEPSNTAYVAVFNTATDTEIDTGKGGADGLKGIPLPIRNPLGIQYLSDNDTVYVQGIGSYGAGYTGGIADLDPTTYDTNIVLDDGDDNNHPYGRISGMALVSPTKCYFIGYDGWGDNTLYSFNPSTDAVADAVAGLEHKTLAGMDSGIYVDRNGMLWVCNASDAEMVIVNTANDSINQRVSTDLNPLRVVFCPTSASWLDTDGDGLADDVDDYPENGGLATPETPDGSGKVTIDVTGTAGVSLTDVTILADTDDSLNPEGKPAGYTFPYGLVSFNVTGLTPGANIQVWLTFPNDLPSYAKYYKVDDNGFSEYSRAQISGTRVLLPLTDGGEGDADGLANGTIVDPGGPGAEASPAGGGAAAGDGGGGGGGGGCFISAIIP
ncbi:MAG: choice-of-anchor U domain-containing protein [Thermodesulfobacteriota bacterium]|nr:choice-of-anchor U domain-containing protein [Thermodesulfobacteriota bacterium]